MNQFYFNSAPPVEHRDGNSMVWILIGINVFMYLLFPANSLGHQRLTLYCNPQNFNLLQVVTAGFIHADFGHIFFNMWGLYIFGTLVAPHIGKWNFLWLYLVGVITGNLTFLASYWGAFGGLLGASGAVCAVMVGAAMFEPDRRFALIFFPFAPIKTTTLVICYTILEIIFEVVGAEAGVAHLAHLGGFVGGYLLLHFAFGKLVVWDPVRRLFRRSAPEPRAGGFPWGAPPPPPQYGTGPVTSQELDALLDKISREGINSLSELELQRLRQAREQMRNR